MNKAWRLTLVNNIPTHHQMPLARELHRILGDRFRCVFLSPVEAERSGMGWSDPSAGADDWVIRAWESPEAAENARRSALTADAALLCTLWAYPPVPAWARHRLADGLLTLGFSETRSKPSLRGRRFKDGRPAVGPRALLSLIGALRGQARERRTFASPMCHFLSIGAAAAVHEAARGNFGGRLWKYGYFTDVPDEAPAARTGEDLRVLFAGRLLRWKRVEDLIRAAAILPSQAPRTHFTVIGDGSEKQALLSLVGSLGLGGTVEFQPFLPAAQVREEMRRADVLFLGSDDEEGWGAVVNEGMAEGCVPVVSSLCGAGTYLVHHERTGFKYDVGDVEGLAAILARLAGDRELVQRIGVQAWKYVNEEWSQRVAAERIVEFCGAGLEGGPLARFESGPLSPAAKK